LFEASTHFHDPALGIGEVVLVFVAGAFLGRGGSFAWWLFAGALLLGLAGCELFLIGGLFFYQALCGTLIHGLFGLREFGDAVLAALDFLGNGESVLQRGAIGIFGFLKEFGDLLASVVGVGVSGEETNGDVFIGECFDAAAGESARRVAVDEQAQHHGGRVLGMAGAALVGAGLAQVERFDRIHDEMDHVVGRYPVAQVRRQEQRGVVVDVDESGEHFTHTRHEAGLFRKLGF